MLNSHLSAPGNTDRRQRGALASLVRLLHRKLPGHHRDQVSVQARTAEYRYRLIIDDARVDLEYIAEIIRDTGSYLLENLANHFWVQRKRIF